MWTLRLYESLTDTKLSFVLRTSICPVAVQLEWLTIFGVHPVPCNCPCPPVACESVGSGAALLRRVAEGCEQVLRVEGGVECRPLCKLLVERRVEWSGGGLDGSGNRVLTAVHVRVRLPAASLFCRALYYCLRF